MEIFAKMSFGVFFLMRNFTFIQNGVIGDG